MRAAKRNGVLRVLPICPSEKPSYIPRMLRFGRLNRGPKRCCFPEAEEKEAGLVEILPALRRFCGN